jgi:hypothetical protein
MGAPHIPAAASKFDRSPRGVKYVAAVSNGSGINDLGDHLAEAKVLMRDSLFFKLIQF